MDPTDTLDFMNSYVLDQQPKAGSSGNLSNMTGPNNSGQPLTLPSNTAYVQYDSTGSGNDYMMPTNTSAPGFQPSYGTSQNVANNVSSFGIEYTDQPVGQQQQNYQPLQQQQQQQQQQQRHNTYSQFVSNQPSQTQPYSVDGANGFDSYLSMLGLNTDISNTNSVTQPQAFTSAASTAMSAGTSGQIATDMSYSFDADPTLWSTAAPQSSSPPATQASSMVAPAFGQPLSDPNPGNVYSQPHLPQYQQQSSNNWLEANGQQKFLEQLALQAATGDEGLPTSSNIRSDLLLKTLNPQQSSTVADITSAQNTGLKAFQQGIHAYTNQPKPTRNDLKLKENQRLQSHRDMPSPQPSPGLIDANGYINTRNIPSNGSDSSSSEVFASSMEAKKRSGSLDLASQAKKQKTSSELYDGLSSASARLLSTLPESERIRITVRAIILTHIKSSSPSDLANRFETIINKIDLSGPGIPEPDEFRIVFEVALDTKEVKLPNTFWIGLRAKEKVLAKMLLWVANMAKNEKYANMTPVLTAILKISLTQQMLDHYHFTRLFEAIHKQTKGEASILCGQILQHAEKMSVLDTERTLAPRLNLIQQNPTANRSSSSPAPELQRKALADKVPTVAKKMAVPSSTSDRKVAIRTPVEGITSEAPRSKSITPTPIPKATIPFIQPITSSSRKKAKAESPSVGSSLATTASRVVKKPTTSTSTAPARSGSGTKVLNSFTIPKRSADTKGSDSSSTLSAPGSSSGSASTGSSFFKSLKSNPRPSSAGSTAATQPKTEPSPQVKPPVPVVAPQTFSFSSHMKSLRASASTKKKKSVSPSAQEAKEPKKKKKVVHWRDENDLVEVKEYYLDPEERAGKRGSNNGVDFKDMDRGEGRKAFSMAISEEDDPVTDVQGQAYQGIPWRTPPKIIMPESMLDKVEDIPVKRGGICPIDSEEAESRKNIERNVLMTVYMNDSEIPDSPAEPPELLKDDFNSSAKTRTIPMATQLVNDPLYLDFINDNNGPHDVKPPPVPEFSLPMGMPPPLPVVPPASHGFEAISSLLSGLQQTMKPQPDHSNDNDGYDPMQPNAAALLSQVYGSGNNNTHLNSNYEHRENGYNSYNANSSINNKGFNNFKKKPFKLSQKQLELRAKDVRPYVRNDNSTFDKWRHPCSFYKTKCSNGDRCHYLHINDK